MKQAQMNAIKIATLTLGLGLTSTLWAQSSSPEVFTRVEKNIENATANKGDSQANLKTVSENHAQVIQARSQTQAEGAKIKAELAMNLKTSSEIEKSMDGLKATEDQEKKSIQSEEKKISELEAMISKLRSSIDGRKTNLANTGGEREKLQAVQSEWKSRGDTLQKLNAEARVRDERLAKEETEWRSKKTKYEKDIEKWNSVLSEQEKVKKNLASLKSQ